MSSPVTYPVVEAFGPTIQGEGFDQGVPCHFVRLGGCDYRCDFCDTPHAVLPDQVRLARRLTPDEILDDLRHLSGQPKWVIVSGGNPAIMNLTSLLNALHDDGYLVALETQGSRDNLSMYAVDRLCLSPKPPSSGMKTDWVVLDNICRKVSETNAETHYAWGFLKVVVFDHADYEYAQRVHSRYPGIPFYLSAGNDAGKTVGNPSRVDDRTLEQVRNDLLNKSRWLWNRVIVDPGMADAHLQSQYHVLVHGNQLGV